MGGVLDPPCRLRLAGAAPVAVDLDLLLAEGLGNLLLLDLGVLVEADALLGDGLLFDDGLFLVEDDLVLFLGDGGAVHGVAGVGVGDRLALDADLFAAHGDGLLDLVLDDVLAQPGPAGLALGLADLQLLFGAGHGVVGRRAAHVAADGAGLIAAGVDVRAAGAAGAAGAALGQPGVRAR